MPLPVSFIRGEQTVSPVASGRLSGVGNEVVVEQLYAQDASAGDSPFSSRMNHTHGTPRPAHPRTGFPYIDFGSVATVERPGTAVGLLSFGRRSGEFSPAYIGTEDLAAEATNNERLFITSPVGANGYGRATISMHGYIDGQSRIKLYNDLDEDGLYGGGGNPPALSKINVVEMGYPTFLELQGTLEWRGFPAGESAPAVAPVGMCRVYFDATSGKLRGSEGGGPYVDVIGGGAGGTPANTVVLEQAFGQGSNSGSSGLFSRGDHTHGTPSARHPQTGHPYVDFGVAGLLQFGRVATELQAGFIGTQDLGSSVGERLFIVPPVRSNGHGASVIDLLSNADGTATIKLYNDLDINSVYGDTGAASKPLKLILNGRLEFATTADTPAVSGVGAAILWYSSSQARLMLSENGSAYAPLTSGLADVNPTPNTIAKRNGSGDLLAVGFTATGRITSVDLAGVPHPNWQVFAQTGVWTVKRFGDAYDMMWIDSVNVNGRGFRSTTYGFQLPLRGGEQYPGWVFTEDNSTSVRMGTVGPTPATWGSPALDYVAFSDRCEFNFYNDRTTDGFYGNAGNGINGPCKVNISGDLVVTGVVQQQGTGSHYFMGRVGIGTQTPTAKLDVRGGLRVGTNANFNDVGDSAQDGHISCGSTNLDYTPTSGNWNSTGMTLILHASTYSAIGFHDAGARVDAIRVGNGVMELGYNSGWGNPQVYVPGVFTQGVGSQIITLSAGDPATGGWVRNDGANMVVSTNVGDLFLGYGGRVAKNIQIGNGNPGVIRVQGSTTQELMVLESGVVKVRGSGLQFPVRSPEQYPGWIFKEDLSTSVRLGIVGPTPQTWGAAAIDMWSFSNRAEVNLYNDRTTDGFYGNAGNGVNGPFKVNISGDLTVTGTATFSGAFGSPLIVEHASDPQIVVRIPGGSGGSVYLGNANHGLKRNGNDVHLYTSSGSLRLSAAGYPTSVLELNSSNQVGIGIAAGTEGAKLAVDGVIHSDGTAAALGFDNRSNTSQRWQWYSDGPARLWSSVTGALFSVDTGGNTAVSGGLTVAGTFAPNSFRVPSTGTNRLEFTTFSGSVDPAWAFYTNSTQFMPSVIGSAGAGLQIVAGMPLNGDGRACIRMHSLSAIPRSRAIVTLFNDLDVGGSYGEGQGSGSNEGLQVQVYGGALNALTYDTMVMQIDSDTIRTGIGLRAGSFAGCIRLQSDIAGAVFRNSNDSGYITFTADFVDVSARAMKTEIRHVGRDESILDKVSRLRPARYVMPIEIPDDVPHTAAHDHLADERLGLIADELVDILPEAVTYDADGEPMGIRYSAVTAALVAAVQELQRQVAALR